MNNNGGTNLEEPTSAEGLMDYDAESLKATLETDFGHESVSIADDLTSGLAMILVEDEYWSGGADPRRSGAVGPSEGMECGNNGTMTTPPTLSPNADSGMTTTPPTSSPKAESTPAASDDESGANSMIRSNKVVMGLLSTVSAFLFARIIA